MQKQNKTKYFRSARLRTHPTNHCPAFTTLPGQTRNRPGMSEVSPGESGDAGNGGRAKRKRPDVARRKQRQGDLRSSIVKTTLRSALLPGAKDILLPLLENASRQLTRATVEASKLLLLAVVDACGREERMPEMSQTFFNHALGVVSTATETRKPKPAHPMLTRAAQLYAGVRLECSEEGGDPGGLASRTHISRPFNDAARDMETNFKNHVATNFEGFTRRWIWVIIRQVGVQLPKAKDTKRLVNHIYRALNYGLPIPKMRDGEGPETGGDREEDEEEVDGRVIPVPITSEQRQALDARVVKARKFLDRDWSDEMVRKSAAKKEKAEKKKEAANASKNVPNSSATAGKNKGKGKGKKKARPAKPTHRLLPATERSLEANWEAYLPWFYRVLKELEADNKARGVTDNRDAWKRKSKRQRKRENAAKRSRGERPTKVEVANRLFCVVPQSSTTAKYAAFDTNALRDLLVSAREKRRKVERSRVAAKALAEGLNKTASGQAATKAAGRAGVGIPGFDGDGGIPDKDDFYARRDEMWKRVLGVRRLEGPKRKFAHRILTDGESVALRFEVGETGGHDRRVRARQRKKESERVLAAKEKWGGEALKAAKRAHTDKMRKEKAEKAEKEAANCGSPKWEGSIEIAPGTRHVGLDPGRRDVFVAVWERDDRPLTRPRPRGSLGDGTSSADRRRLKRRGKMRAGFEREWEKDELGKVRRKKGVTSTREGASEEAGDATIQQVVEKGKEKRGSRSERRARHPDHVASCSNAQWHTMCGYRERQRKTAAWAAKAHPHVREMLQCPTPKTAGLDGALSHVRFVVRRLDSNVQFACSRRVKRLAFTTYTKGQRALSDLTFLLSGGDPSTVVAFGAGTFSPTSKGHAPGPVKKLRRELSSICRVRATNEDYTSQACSRCGHKSKLVGPRRKEEAKEGGAGSGGERGVRSEIHGVRVCSNCRMTWNRDVNAALNMRAVHAHMNAHDGERPARFRRPVAKTKVATEGGTKRGRGGGTVSSNNGVKGGGGGKRRRVAVPPFRSGDGGGDTTRKRRRSGDGDDRGEGQHDGTLAFCKRRSLVTETWHTQ